MIIIEAKYLDSFLGVRPTSNLIPALYEIYKNNSNYYNDIDYHYKYEKNGYVAKIKNKSNLNWI